jgi:hypothetical protein
MILSLAGVARAKWDATAWYVLADTPILFGRTSVSPTAGVGTVIAGSAAPFMSMYFPASSPAQLIRFLGSVSGGLIGSIRYTGSQVVLDASSDYRLKQNLREIPLGLTDQIEVYEFEWSSDESTSYGVLAHELAEILPSVVYGEKDAVDEDLNVIPQSVDYLKLVPILIRDLQDARSTILELSARIEVLEGA